MKFKEIKITALTFSIVLSLLSTGCTKKKEEFPKASNEVSSAVQEVSGSTLFCYDGSTLVWKLDCDYSRRNMDDSSKTLVVPVRLTVFDSSGVNETKVFSDSGHTAEDLNKFFIWGNVDVRNWDGLRIRSQSLWWDKSKRVVGSDDYVKIITPGGDVLKGKGLDASENFSWWTLRKNVSGEFPNFKDPTNDKQNE